VSDSDFARTLPALLALVRAAPRPLDPARLNVALVAIGLSETDAHRHVDQALACGALRLTSSNRVEVAPLPITRIAWTTDGALWMIQDFVENEGTAACRNALAHVREVIATVSATWAEIDRVAGLEKPDRALQTISFAHHIDAVERLGDVPPGTSWVKRVPGVPMTTTELLAERDAARAALTALETRFFLTLSAVEELICRAAPLSWIGDGDIVAAKRWKKDAAAMMQAIDEARTKRAAETPTAPPAPKESP